LHAAHPVHAEIGDDEVKAAGLDAAQGFLAARRRLDLVALLREQPAQRDQQRLLVVDYEDSSGHRTHLSGERSADWSAHSGIGRVRTNSVPRPGSLATSIVPAWASTILREIAMPSPVPFSFVVKNGLKMRSSLSGGMPHPLSRTRTTALLPPFSMNSSMRPSSGAPPPAA